LACILRLEPQLTGTEPSNACYHALDVCYKYRELAVLESNIMKLGINTYPSRHRPGAPHETGYIRPLLRTLEGLQQDLGFVVFTHEENHAAYADWERVPISPGSGTFSVFRSNSGELEDAIAAAGVDIVLSPLESAPLLTDTPQVLYALDLALWSREPEPPRRAKGPDLKSIRQISAQSRGLIVPSEYLRRRCLELFEIPLNRTTVAPVGVDPVFRLDQAPLLNQSYILTIVDGLTRESMEPLRQTLAKRKSDFHHTLVVVGAKQEGEPQNWGPGVVRIEECAANHLATLYQHCSLFLYPAEQDGSALHVLEALQAGAPVVAPSTGAIAELAGSAPVFFNPNSTGSLLRAMRRVLHEDREQSQSRIQRGHRTASDFTWEKSAWKVLAALKRS
jgi:glycosyltransferase involved in cell wall biosynthesis